MKRPEIVERLAEVVLSETDETDIAIRDERVEVLRYASPDVGGAKAMSGVVGWRLEKTPEGGLDRVRWNPASRIAPKEPSCTIRTSIAGEIVPVTIADRDGASGARATMSIDRSAP
jgi:hypothetical protein